MTVTKFTFFEVLKDYFCQRFTFNFNLQITINMTIEEALTQGTLIDVREPMEFQMQHAEGAINIPLGEIMNKQSDINTMKKPILLYCQSGNRSGQAEMLLRTLGVEDAFNIGSVFEVIQLQRQMQNT